MTTAQPAARLAGAAVARVPSPRLLGDPLRVLLAAGLTASVLLHGQMALGGAHGRGWSVLMGLMAALCLSCLLALVRPAAVHRTSGTVRTAMGMALAMALGHVVLLPLMSGGGHAQHGALPAGTASAAAGGAAHGTGALLVIAVELAVAALAVAWLRRHEPRPTYRSV